MAIGLMALTLALVETVSAQPGGGGGFGGGGGAGGGGFGGGGGMQGMDATQLQEMIQQRLSDSYREQMSVTNDEEWALIDQRIKAVTKAQSAMSADGGGMGGLGGLIRGFGGGRGGRGGGGMGGGGGGALAGLFGQQSPEAEALQKAIDANAPAAQIKGLMEKFVAVRKAKQDALAKAQEELRQLLTTRQEAVALVNGLL